MTAQKPCYILAIESSCDDTAAAILKNDTVLSNRIANQAIMPTMVGLSPSWHRGTPTAYCPSS